MCCSPAGYQLHQLISALREKEGQRSSLGRPPVGEQEQPVARPCLQQGTPAPCQGWWQSKPGARLGATAARVSAWFCHLPALWLLCLDFPICNMGLPTVPAS